VNVISADDEGPPDEELKEESTLVEAVEVMELMSIREADRERWMVWNEGIGLVVSNSKESNSDVDGETSSS
jgi:hypothetical protein